MTEQLSLSLHDAISRHPVTNLQVLLSFFLGVWGTANPAAYGILVPRPGIESVPSAVKTQSPNHWTTREFPPGVSNGGTKLKMPPALRWSKRAVDGRGKGEASRCWQWFSLPCGEFHRCWLYNFPLYCYFIPLSIGQLFFSTAYT